MIGTNFDHSIFPFIIVVAYFSGHTTIITGTVEFWGVWTVVSINIGNLATSNLQVSSIFLIFDLCKIKLVSSVL